MVEDNWEAKQIFTTTAFSVTLTKHNNQATGSKLKALVKVFSYINSTPLGEAILATNMAKHLIYCKAKQWRDE